MTTPRHYHAGDSGSHELRALVDGKEIPNVRYADMDQGYVARYATVHDFTPDELATLAKVKIGTEEDGLFLHYPGGLIVDVVVRGNVEIVRVPEDDK